MSFIRFNSAEGGSNTTTVTAANSGAGSGYAFDSVTGGSAVTFSNTQVQSGALSYRFTLAAATGYFTSSIPTLQATLWQRSWVWIDTAFPSVTLWFHTIQVTSGAVYARAGISTAGKLNCFAGGGATAAGAYTYAVNTWYRLETQYDWPTNTVITKTYDNSGNLLETVTSAASTTQWTGFRTAYFGTVNSSPTGTFYMDNLAISDQGWIGTGAAFSLWKQNTAEGGSSGTTLTVANSGGLSGDAFDSVSGTVTFDNTDVQSGSLSYKYAAVSSYGRYVLPGTASIVYARAYIYFTSLAATQSSPIYITCDAGAHVAQLAYQPAVGHWMVILAGASTVNGTTVPVINTWYRLELQVITGATTGQIVARIYDISGNLLETITSAAAGTITVPQYADIGQRVNQSPSYWLDDVAVSDQGWIGPAATVWGPVAASASAAPAGTVGVTVPGAVAASVSSAPAGAVTGTASLTGLVAASTSQATAGTITGDANVPGLVAASTSQATAGTITGDANVPGAVVASVGRAAPGTVGVTVRGAAAVAASAAPPGAVAGTATAVGAVAASTSTAPAGTITGTAAVAGAVAATATAATAGTVTFTAGVTGAVAAAVSTATPGGVSVTAAGTAAASVSTAPAGTVTGTATVPGSVAASTSTAPAGTITESVTGAAATASSTAPPGSVTADTTTNGAIATSSSFAPAGFVVADANISGTIAYSATWAPAGTVFCVQKPIGLTVGAARTTWRAGAAQTTWTTGAARTNWVTGRGRIT